MKTFLFLVVTIITFLAPIKGMLLFMIITILLDTFSGIYVTVKLKGWSSITSTKFFNIVVKSFFYLTTIIMAFMLDKWVFDGELMGIKLLLSKGMLSLWTYNEFSSINENSMKLGNRSFWIIFKEFIGKMKDMKKDISDIIDDDKKDSTE